MTRPPREKPMAFGRVYMRAKAQSEPICYLLKKHEGHAQYWRDDVGVRGWTHDTVDASQFNTWSKAEEKRAVLAGRGVLVMIITKDSTKFSGFLHEAREFLLETGALKFRDALNLGDDWTPMLLTQADSEEQAR